MPIPSSITDLSTTAASNSPLGSEPPTEGDNHIRALAAIVRQVYDAQAASGGSALVGFIQSGSGAVARTAQAKMRDVLHAKDFGAVGDDSTDDTTALQAWATACSTQGVRGMLGAGTFRISTVITLATGGYISGENPARTIIHAGGCNGIQITGAFAGVENLQIKSSDATFATPDPRASKGIYVSGTAISHRDNIHLRNLYLRGWEYGVDAHYLWSSFFENVETVNTDYGIRLHEQCVNNSISDCRLVVNSGTASLVLSNDVTPGEGLMVSNCMMVSGDYGIYVKNHFLSASFTNCIVDLIQDRGIYVQNTVVGLSFVGGWIYAVNYGAYFSALGSPQDTNAVIQTLITTTAAASNGISWGADNNGLAVGGTIICGASGLNYAVNIDGGDAVSFGPLHIVNSGTALGVRVGGDDVQGLHNITGVKNVAYSVTPFATVASSATIVLPRSYNNAYLITGTTGITSVTATGWDGEIVTLLFNNTLTVTDGSNLKLAGNFSATADDVLRLLCDGTNWYEVSRSNN
jgi:hypothetical protein